MYFGVYRLYTDHTLIVGLKHICTNLLSTNLTFSWSALCNHLTWSTQCRFTGWHTIWTKISLLCSLLLSCNTHMSDSSSLWLHPHTGSSHGDCRTTLFLRLSPFSLFFFWLLVVEVATLRLALCFSTHACLPCLLACASPAGGGGGSLLR